MEIVSISVVEPTQSVTISVVTGFATVVNSDNSYSLNAPVGATSTLPDITVTDSDGSTFTQPAVTDVVCSAPVGSDVENSDGSYTAHVNNGATLVLPDTTVKNTAGTTVLVQPSCTNTGVIADCRVVNSDLTYDELVPAETTHNLPDVPNVDSDGSTVMTPAMTPFVATSCPPTTYASAKVMKTGQTTSYIDYDDGYYEAGREDDFFTLKSNNPFGNTNRFTDELGGSTYTNNIIIDWSTFDGGSVLGYYRQYNLNSDFSTAISTANGLSIGIYVTGWRLANRREMENVIYSESNLPLNYAPFNYSSSTPLINSTTVKPLTGYSFRLDQYHQMSSVSKSAGGGNYLACRTFTVSGTTLT